MGDFRSTFKTRVPPAIGSGGGEAVLYVQGLLFDVMRQVLRDGIQVRFPSHASASGLTKLGQDRGIPRGRTEPAENYAERLKRWRNPRGHKTRGSAFALLEQIWEYWGAIRCWTIDVNENRHVRTYAGAESVEYGYPWDWDGDLSRRYRFWFVLEPVPDRADIEIIEGVEGEWESSIDHDHGGPYCAGFRGMTPSDWDAMRRLYTSRNPWKPAGTLQQFAVVHTGDYTSETVPTPTGNWDDIHERINVELANPTIRFVRLVRP